MSFVLENWTEPSDNGGKKEPVLSRQRMDVKEVGDNDAHCLYTTAVRPSCCVLLKRLHCWQSTNVASCPSWAVSPNFTFLQFLKGSFASHHISWARARSSTHTQPRQNWRWSRSIDRSIGRSTVVSLLGGFLLRILYWMLYRTLPVQIVRKEAVEKFRHFFVGRTRFLAE